MIVEVLKIQKNIALVNKCQKHKFRAEAIEGNVCTKNSPSFTNWAFCSVVKFEPPVTNLADVARFPLQRASLFL